MPNFKHLLPVTIGLTVACSSGQEASSDLVVLTPEPAGYAEPTYSPDGARLAFTRRNGGEEAVWVTDLAGGTTTRVSPEAGNVANLAWSPDSRDLVFVSSTGGPPSIWSTSADGGEAQQLVEWLSVTPQFSPDGSQILFLGLRDQQPSNWVMPADGGQPAPLSTNPGEWGGRPRWSPDGTRVAMTVQADGKSVVGLYQPDGMSMAHLTGEGFENFQEWSPDGTELVYTSSRTGLRDVWVVPAAGGQPRQLTRDIRDDWGPTYSRDGRWIAYHSERGGQDDIWIVAAEGGESIRVTNDAAEEFGVTWTPDGTGLTFGRSEQVSHIFRVTADGGTPEQLTSGNSDSYQHDVSGEGRLVVYGAERSGDEQLIIRPADGGEERVLVSGGGSNAIPRLSPDESMVAFESTRGGKWGIWVVPTEGGEPVRVSPEGFTSRNAVWSPDGTRIAFWTDAVGGVGKIMTAPAGGGAATLVSDVDFTGGPEWSPDGRTIAFMAVTGAQGNTKRAIHVAPAAGGAAVVLTEGQDAFAARWSPDGSMLTYAATMEGGERSDIWVMNADGSNKRRLTTHPAADLNPRFTPDGSQIYFGTRRNGSWDIAMVPVAGGEVRVVYQTPMNVGNQQMSSDGAWFYFQGTPTDNQIVTVNVEHLLTE